MRVLLVILGLGVLLSPLAIHVWWPNDFNWAVAFIGNFLIATITAIVSILYASSRQKSEAVRSWLPFAESACESVYTIEATAKECVEKIKDDKSPCKLILDNLKDDSSPAVVQFVKQHCERCQQTLQQIIRTVESTENNWFRFINANCEKGECDEIFSRLEQRKEQLGLS